MFFACVSSAKLALFNLALMTRESINFLCWSAGQVLSLVFPLSDSLWFYVDPHSFPDLFERRNNYYVLTIQAYHKTQKLTVVYGHSHFESGGD